MSSPSETAAPAAPREAVRRNGPFAGPAILSQGFRPFFLLAGIWAVVALWAFLALVNGWLEGPVGLDLVAWHAHTQIFGFAGAALAGFLLTAIPNWTGRLPLQGGPLLVLVVLWLLARGADLALLAGGGGLAGLLVLLFPAALLAAAGREILAGKNWRNLPIIGVLAVFLLADALFVAAALGASLPEDAVRRLGLAVFAALISLIGGRVVPSFTLNWLRARGETDLPAGFGWVDRATLLLTVAALLSWVLAPVAAATALLAAVAAPAHLWRLARWQGWRTRGEPLLWVLHLAYLWLPLSFAMIAGAALFEVVPAAAATHAIGTGAMGTMILAIMSRATLGHSGRPLEAGPLLTLAFVAVTLAALARIAAAFAPEAVDSLLPLAGLAWTVAFLLFLARCGPALVTPRRREG